MPITDAIHKADRLEEVKLLFRRRPQGVGSGEIARILEVSQRTARRYVQELSEKGRLPVYREGRVWKLMKGAHIDLSRIQLNLDESLALYLAARMLSTNSDKHNPHLVSSLFKLAVNFPDAIRTHVEEAAEAVSQRRPTLNYLKVLEGLTRAWADRRQVQLVYREPISRVRSARLFDLYFIEPSYVDYSYLCVGFDHSRQAIRSFKVEHLEQVEILDSHFEPLPDFDPCDYLRHALGIRGGVGVVEVNIAVFQERGLSSEGT